MNELRQLSAHLPELLTTTELAKILRVHPKTVRRRILRGDILAHKPGGLQEWRIRRSEVLRLVSS